MTLPTVSCREMVKYMKKIYMKCVYSHQVPLFHTRKKNTKYIRTSMHYRFIWHKKTQFHTHTYVYICIYIYIHLLISLNDTNNVTLIYLAVVEALGATELVQRNHTTGHQLCHGAAWLRNWEHRTMWLNDPRKINSQICMKPNCILWFFDFLQ